MNKIEENSNEVHNLYIFITIHLKRDVKIIGKIFVLLLFFLAWLYTTGYNNF